MKFNSHSSAPIHAYILEQAGNNVVVLILSKTVDNSRIKPIKSIKLK